MLQQPNTQIALGTKRDITKLRSLGRSLLFTHRQGNSSDPQTCHAHFSMQRLDGIVQNWTPASSLSVQLFPPCPAQKKREHSPSNLHHWAVVHMQS